VEVPWAGDKTCEISLCLSMCQYSLFCVMNRVYIDFLGSRRTAKQKQMDEPANKKVSVTLRFVASPISFSEALQAFCTDDKRDSSKT
jgi:hypothetical protein